MNCFFYLVSGKTKAPYLWHLRLPTQQTPSKQSQQRPREKLTYNFVARGSQAECDFALFINLCFHRFGIRSCLATMWRLSSNWRHSVDVASRGIFKFSVNNEEGDNKNPWRWKADNMVIHPLWKETIFTVAESLTILLIKNAENYELYNTVRKRPRDGFARHF